MRRSGFAAIFLVIVICTACVTGPVFAADAESEAEISTAPSVPGDIAEVVLPSDVPGEDQDHTAEPTEQPTDAVETPDPTPAPEPDETEEPSAEPSTDPGADPSPTAEPTDTPQEPAVIDSPVLEMSAGQTIYLNQETPAVKIRWKSGIPDSVAGYVWSFGTSSSSKQVFYVTYDASSTALAAGALNGHVSSAGTYKIWCQPINADQDAVTPPACIELRVVESACELNVSADQGMPVAAGSRVVLTANAGSLSSEVLRYEWKPSGSGSGGSTCRIDAVAAGPVRYTCTAVLKSGQRVTGTLVVTGTELIASQRSVTLGTSDTVNTLSVAWSNGAPAGSIRYRWSVRGEPESDLSAYAGMSLPTKYLTDLKARSNPYTISCQPYNGALELGGPATMQVRVSGSGVVADPTDTARTIAGNEYGKAPDTSDSRELPAVWIMLAGAAVLVLTRSLRTAA